MLARVLLASQHGFVAAEPVLAELGEARRALAHDGVDLTPRLAELAASATDPRRPMGSTTMADRVRYEMFRRTGYFVTESSEHFSEYTPWFIKRDRPDLIERFDIPLDEYPRRCEEQIAGWEALRARLEHDDRPLTVRRSAEYGSGIIHSVETGEPRVVYGNVPNRDLIDNLPEGCCVEVPCLVDRNGVQPTAIGALPPQRRQRRSRSCSWRAYC